MSTGPGTKIVALERWDPDDLVSAVEAECVHVVEAAVDVCADTRLPEPVREGLALITAELVGHAVRGGAPGGRS